MSMGKLVEWLNPDAHGRVGSALLLALWVGAASAILAWVVKGNIADATAFGVLLGGVWGLTRGFGTRRHVDEPADDNDPRSPRRPAR